MNWDPVDQTVLANEQVDDQGRSWRSGAKVERKVMTQWFFRTSKLAEELNKDLDDLKDWPEVVREMQRGWIGRKEGSLVTFDLVKSEGNEQKSAKLDIFTTRLDTFFGVTFIGLSFEHHLAQSLVELEKNPSVAQEFNKILAEIRNKSEIAKKTEQKTLTSGLKLENTYCVSPITGEKIPIYFLDYVLMDYGTGAIMGVPAHDKRDNIAAEKLGIPSKKVVEEVLRGKNLVESETKVYLRNRK